eukprot:1160412-Pelagomonas_calceolata.AAC.14
MGAWSALPAAAALCLCVYVWMMLCRAAMYVFATLCARAADVMMEKVGITLPHGSTPPSHNNEVATLSLTCSYSFGNAQSAAEGSSPSTYMFMLRVLNVV